MTNGNLKSLGEILWKVMKNPLASELTYEEAAEYALEFIKLLGAPSIYENKLSIMELTNHKAELPCDLLTIEGVRYLDTSDPETASASNYIAMREATNLYHFDENEHLNEQDTEFNIRGNHRRSEFTYKVQRGIIFTSMRDGCIEMAYKAISTDEEGFPLVPDNEKVAIGMEYYILSRYLEPLWMMGKITDKAFEYITQKRYFYMPSAFTAMQMPSKDMLESTMNGINRLLLSTTMHEKFYKKLGEEERFRKFR
jgi:hypothetical protein